MSQTYKFKPIYKYRANNDSLDKLLINGQLYFSSPLDFNDPFDSNLKLIDEVTKEHILHSYSSAQLHESAFFEDILKLALDDKDIRKNIFKLFESKFYEFARQASVCSFSKRHNILLLWAHYTDCHKGVCLGFDPYIMTEALGELHDINYTSKIPAINPFEDPISSIKQFFCTKSKHWSYEKEIRILRGPAGFYEFPKEALVRVVFGVKCSNEEKKRIMLLIKNYGYCNVEFIQTFIDKNYFRLLGQRIHLDKD